MRTIFITLIFIFNIIYCAFGDPGILADYNLNGTSIGGTKLKGNLRIMMKSQANRLTGNIFYQEAGNPFPDLDEKDLIINFKKKKKHIMTSEAMDWYSSSLTDDYEIIPDSKISISIKKTSKEITAIINLNLASELGGKQKYIIKFTYTSTGPGGEESVLKQINQPTGAGVLSMFIDNEKIIELLSKKLLNNKYKIPEKFQITWKQNNKTQLDVKGKLNIKSNIDLDDSDFQK